MLYLVATPIGNSGDITYRAIMVLDRCDYILCEDTRNSLPLMKNYGIAKPLKSYHKFSEAKQEESIIEDLKAGKEIALISDAGTPGISDPGTRLVKRCKREGIPVTAIPGPCAAIAALTISGLDTDRFQFLGFLSKNQNEKTKALVQSLLYPGTTIFYDSALRLMNTLSELQRLASKRTLVVARELTKKFEEVQTGTAEELIEHFKKNPLKGEIILLVSGDKTSDKWDELSPSEHVDYLQKTYDLEKKEAIKLASEIRGIPKREVYKSTQ